MAEFVDQIPQQPGLAFEEKTHQYILNGTQVLPSVTTLMKPLSDTLYAGIRPETLQAAAERGTEVHSAIEDYVTLGITDISEARRGYFEAFLRWMKDYNVQPLSVEHRAYHPALGYAGTLDMLCTLSKGDTDPQVLTLVDFKTSATVNKMLTGVQLEAYEQMLAATGLQVEQMQPPPRCRLRAKLCRERLSVFDKACARRLHPCRTRPKTRRPAPRHQPGRNRQGGAGQLYPHGCNGKAHCRTGKKGRCVNDGHGLRGVLHRALLQRVLYHL